jgi:tetratricopeptide (TPR) repeat protein
MASEQSADELHAAGREFLKAKDYGSAISAFEESIAVDQRHIPAHEGLATTCFATHAFERAAELFHRVSLLDPRRAEPLINLGAVLNRQGDYGKAVRVLRQALAKNRTSAEAYYNLGIAYKSQAQ